MGKKIIRENLGQSNDGSQTATGINAVSHSTQQSNNVSSSADSSSSASLTQSIKLNMQVLPFCNQTIQEFYAWQPDNLCLTNDLETQKKNYIMKTTPLNLECCKSGHYATKSGMKTFAITGNSGPIKASPADERVIQGRQDSCCNPNAPGGTKNIGCMSKVNGQCPNKNSYLQGPGSGFELDNQQCAPIEDPNNPGNYINGMYGPDDICPRDRLPPGVKWTPLTGTLPPGIKPDSAEEQLFRDGLLLEDGTNCISAEQLKSMQCGIDHVNKLAELGKQYGGDDPKLAAQFDKDFKLEMAACEQQRQAFIETKEKLKGECIMDGCTVNASEDGKATSSSLAKVHQKSIAKFSAVTSDTLSNSLAQQMKQANQGGIYPSLISPESNTANQNATAVNSVRTATSQSNNVSANATSTAIATSDQTLIASIPLGCKDSTLNFNIKGTADAQASAHIKQTSETMMKSQNTTDLSNSIKQALTQSNKGFLANFGMLLLVIIIIIVVIIIFTTTPLGDMFKHGQSDGNAKSNNKTFLALFLGAGIFVMAGIGCIVYATIHGDFKSSKTAQSQMKENWAGIEASRKGGATNPNVYCPKPSKSAAASVNSESGGKAQCKTGEKCCYVPPFNANFTKMSRSQQLAYIPADNFACSADETDHGCTGVPFSNLRYGAVIQYTATENISQPGGTEPTKLVLLETVDTIKRSLQSELSSIKGLISTNKSNVSTLGEPGVQGGKHANALGSMALEFLLSLYEGTRSITGKATPAAQKIGVAIEVLAGEGYRTPTNEQQYMLMNAGLDLTAKWMTPVIKKGSGNDAIYGMPPIGNTTGSPTARDNELNGSLLQPFFAPPSLQAKTGQSGLLPKVGFIASTFYYLSLFDLIQFYNRYEDQDAGNGLHGKTTDSYLVYSLKKDAKWPTGFSESGRVKYNSGQWDTAYTESDYTGNTTPTPEQVSQALCYITSAVGLWGECFKQLFPRGNRAGGSDSYPVVLKVSTKDAKNGSWGSVNKALADQPYMPASSLGFAANTGFSPKVPTQMVHIKHGTLAAGGGLGIPTVPKGFIGAYLLGAIDINKFVSHAVLLCNGPPGSGGAITTKTESDSQSFGTQQALMQKYASSNQTYEHFKGPGRNLVIAGSLLVGFGIFMFVVGLIYWGLRFKEVGTSENTTLVEGNRSYP